MVLYMVLTVSTLMKLLAMLVWAASSEFVSSSIPS